VNDVCAWLLLAVGLTLIPHTGESMGLPIRLLWLCIYVAIMLGLIRPLGQWAAERQKTDALSYEILGVVVATLLVSAAATEAIGIHPLFGAFLAGVCFPRIERWQRAVRTRLDTIVSILLLPLFFALTGMRTRLDLLSGATIWLWTGVVLIAAVAGKMGGTVLAARLTGQSWRDAMALGALLNTRGLVELVVLNIAYSAHVFSPTLFTMLVVMALVTTMMTSPVLNLLGVEDKSAKPRNLVTVSSA
jgi:Kef-type K+ transport system membrane component KefB